MLALQISTIRISYFCNIVHTKIQAQLIQSRLLKLQQFQIYILCLSRVIMKLI